MRKITFIIAMFLAGYLSAAQECGTFIELIGVGMAGKSEATITIHDDENVEKIIVQAIHKSETTPATITFSSSKPEIKEVGPVKLDYSGIEPALSVNAYTVELKPAKTVSVQTGTTEGFFSFSAYVFRKRGGIASSINGKLHHVFQNGDDPLVIDIPVPVSDHPRDLSIKFGITELDDDERYAIFKLKAGEVTEEITIWEWNEPEGEKESFTIQEIEFEDVPGNIEQIEMILISPVYTEGNKIGDSFIAGTAVLDVPCEYKEPGLFCTYTQGFYGNRGGRTCQGETTPDLLARLLSEKLVLGGNGNTLTIGAGAVDCILDLLPGGGPSKALAGEATCGNLTGIETNKQGGVKNSLLAQGLTLALNLRNSPELYSFPVDGTAFVTVSPVDCMDPAAGGSGPGSSHSFKQEIADFLGEAAAIGDLMGLVNWALAGGDVSPLSLSQISDAATLVNEVFDECIMVPGMFEPASDSGSDPDETPDDGDINESGDEGDNEGKGDDDGDGESDDDDEDEGDDEGDDDFTKKGATGISDRHPGNDLSLYPNPVTDRFYITLPPAVQHLEAASIYNIMGLPVKNVKDRVLGGVTQLIGIDAGDLIYGIYFIKIDTDAGTFIQRFSVQ